jgi:hypothetical protein
MILCIGTFADQTFLYTVKALSARLNVDIIDLGLLSISGDIFASIDTPNKSFFKCYIDYPLEKYSGIYTRLIEISKFAPSEHLKKRSSSFYQAIKKMLSNIRVPILNPLGSDNSNFTKLYHSIAIASSNKWLMPRSCLTNDYEVALSFIKSCKMCIYKGCSSVKTWAQQVSEGDLRRLKSITKCPVLFQELITGYDVRIHIVGEEMFAEKIISTSVDYRKVKGNKYEKIDLPDYIVEGCRRLVKETNTPFLGIDFKISKNGQWYFLEANNLPCYQGYDLRADCNISNAIVNWFTKNLN